MFIVTEQLLGMDPFPGAQACGVRQPLNTCPGCGSAVSFTTVPAMKLAEQVPGQLIPPGVPIILPLPGGPATNTVNLNTGLNVAVTDWGPLRSSVHVPVPEQLPPLQPANPNPLAATADRVTLVPLLKLAVHAGGQPIPAGLLLTVPLPATVTVNGKLTTPNVAVTELLPFIVIAHPPVPVQAPLHPVKLLPVVGVAVSVTMLPPLKLAVQVPGQLIPAGLLVTVPPPKTVTESGNICVNVAVTDAAALIVTMQLPVPLQPPLQSEKLQPAAGVSVSVTEVPLSNVVEQVPGQAIPDGLLVTVPLPVIVTFNG
jgi:hypothetical protein